MINFKMPKGRQTIRKHGGRHTRLWELAGSSIPAVQRLEVVYLDGHGAMDRTEARHAANKADKPSFSWSRHPPMVSIACPLRPTRHGTDFAANASLSAPAGFTKLAACLPIGLTSTV